MRGAGLAIAIGLAGCAPLVGTIPVPATPPKIDGLEVGAARVDITPLPGYPMGGYSVGGKVARGVWVRLHARAIYVAGEGRARVLVSCDLWSVPAGLGDRVAEILAQRARKDGRRAYLGREDIILAATHTHQSPGNFSTSAAYNALASPRSGFDRRLFEFLASRVADVVERARNRATSAELSVGRTRLAGVFRNRSMPAFRLDPEADALMNASGLNACPTTSAAFPDADACRAVHPFMDVLIARERAHPERILAIAAFLAVHPTVMDDETQVYNGDLFGVAALLAEAGLPPMGDGANAVVALFNGAEGDVSATWNRRDRAEVLALGRRIADAIGLASRSDTPVESSLGEFQYAEIDVAGQRFIDHETHEPSRERRTDRDASVGTSQLGGAEDGRTFFHDLGFVEGRGPAHRGATGAKLSALKAEWLPLQPDLSVVLRLTPPPRSVPIGLYEIGGQFFATLPGEVTTVLGERIRRSIGSALGQPADHVILIGLANEYLSYFTTAEEFEAQHYEGGSTLYGAASGPLLRVRFSELAAALREGSSPRSDRRYTYWPGTSKRFGLETVAEVEPYFPDDGLAAIAQDTRAKMPKRDFPTVCWTDVMRHDGDRPADGSGLPKVAVHDDRHRVVMVDGLPQNELGIDMLTVVRRVTNREVQWCSIWLRPDTTMWPGKLHFHVDTPRRQCRSPDFQLVASALLPCS